LIGKNSLQLVDPAAGPSGDKTADVSDALAALVGHERSWFSGGCHQPVIGPF
jgi:hypothetical protein